MIFEISNPSDAYTMKPEYWKRTTCISTESNRRRL